MTKTGDHKLSCKISQHQQQIITNKECALSAYIASNITPVQINFVNLFSADTVSDNMGCDGMAPTDLLFATVFWLSHNAATYFIT